MFLSQQRFMTDKIENQCVCYKSVNNRKLESTKWKNCFAKKEYNIKVTGLKESNYRKKKKTSDDLLIPSYSCVQKNVQN